MKELRVNEGQIKNSIFNIRGKQVMLDSDLADLYGVSTGRLNEQVKRNVERFPSDFMFSLTEKEWQNLKSQNAISSWGGRRKLPNVFTEQGVSTLSGVLNSKTAIQVNIAIMRAFVGMRKFLMENASIFQRLDDIELKQLESERNIGLLFDALDKGSLKPKQGIFYDGQVFDAYKFVSDLIKSANKTITLVDNYIDDTVLTLFSKNQDISVKIFTKKITKQLELDLEKYNAQYKQIEIQVFKQAHDRFLIIDEEEVYHIGASLKDLGKKWFAFSKFKMEAFELLRKLEN